MINKKYKRVKCNTSDLMQFLSAKANENMTYDFKGLFKDREIPYTEESCLEIIKKGNDLDTFYLFYTTSWTGTQVESKQNYIVEFKKMDKETVGYRVLRKPLLRLKLIIILSIISMFFIWVLVNHFSPFNFIIPIFLTLFLKGLRNSKKEYEKYIENLLNDYGTKK